MVGMYGRAACMVGRKHGRGVWEGGGMHGRGVCSGGDMEETRLLKRAVCS